MASPPWAHEASAPFSSLSTWKHWPTCLRVWVSCLELSSFGPPRTSQSFRIKIPTTTNDLKLSKPTELSIEMTQNPAWLNTDRVNVRNTLHMDPMSLQQLLNVVSLGQERH